jgi:L-ascorbate metabolism protein UlaG (beta-lactamase superfamily)
MPPPCRIQDLLQVNLVVISHDHCSLPQTPRGELIEDDHLDKATILDIEKYYQNVQYLVPTGVKAILTTFGVDPTRVNELAWWEETTITTSPEYLPKEHQIDVIIPNPTFELSEDDPPLSPTSTLFSQATLTNDTSITATCCPAQHNSGRGFFHRNKTLWASWYLTCVLPDGGEYKVYFGG